MCPLKVDLLSVTFDPKTAKICLLIVTHPIGGHYVATIKVATSLVLFFLEARSESPLK